MSRRSRGFTLVEVLIALAIMSLVMIALYSTLNATLHARDQIEVESRVVRLGPQILDIIEDDLRRAWLLDIEGDRVFKGESRTIDGEPADSLSLLTNVDSSVSRRVDDEEIPADVCETGYRLRRNPELPDVFELWRRQSFHVDEEPLKDGVYELLHDRVVRFQLRYLERLDPLVEKLHDWDAAQRHRLPAAVEIELALEAVPRTLGDIGRQNAASRTLEYRRLVALEDHSDIVMRVHAIPPTFTGGENLGDGGKGDGDIDGDGIPDSQDDDMDGDGTPNDSDPDIDGDGTPNEDDTSPNGGGGGGGPGGGNKGDGEGGDDMDNPFGDPTNPGGDGSGGNGDDLGDILDDLLNGDG